MALYDIAFYAALFFIIGTAVAGFGFSWQITLAISVAAGIIFYAKGNSFRRLILLLPAVLIGFSYYNLYASFSSQIFPPLNESAKFYGRVISDPQRGLERERFTLELEYPYSGKIEVYTDAYPGHSYGDYLKIEGKVKQYEGTTLVSFPDISVISSGTGFWLKEKLFAVKSEFSKKIREALPQEKAALMAGLLLGERAEFSSDFKEAMSKSGTSHLTALSGYNISILAFAVSIFLGGFLSRGKAFFVSIGVISLFVVMTGAEASVTRAAIMGVLVLLASKLGRIYSLRNALTLTAFFMVLLDPAILTGNLGFILSFGALLGIVYLAPVLRRILRLKEGDRGWGGWKENGISTLSAQLAVMPVLLHSFGAVSLFSLPANILILEIIPLVMFLGFILGCAGFILSPLSFLLGIMTQAFLSYIIFIINFFARLPVVININSFPIAYAMIYYGLLGALVLYVKLFMEPGNETV